MTYEDGFSGTAASISDDAVKMMRDRSVDGGNVLGKQGGGEECC